MSPPTTTGERLKDLRNAKGTKTLTKRTLQTDMEPHERLHVSLTLKKVKTIFLCINKNALSFPVQPTSIETITPLKTQHAGHTTPNPTHRKSRQSRTGPRPRRRFCWGNGRIPSIPTVLARERPDPFHPGRSG
jgi:hypothetical protein